MLLVPFFLLLYTYVRPFDGDPHIFQSVPFLLPFFSIPFDSSPCFSLGNFYLARSKFTNPIFCFVHLLLYLSNESLTSDTGIQF